jgi:hypothetical protein
VLDLAAFAVGSFVGLIVGAIFDFARWCVG